MDGDTIVNKNDGSTVISAFSYELDKAGIRRSMTDKDEKYNAFLYDPLYQLKAERKQSLGAKEKATDAVHFGTESVAFILYMPAV